MSDPRQAVLVVLASAGLALGCPPGPRVQSGRTPHVPDESQAQAAPESEPADRPHDPQVVATMHAHFATITRARDAAIDGDVAAAKAAGEELRAALASARPPPAWQPFVEHLQTHADALTDADSLEVAARQVARLAAACGECHARTEADPRLPELPELPGRIPPSEVEAVMKWHAWSADRMWEGLVAPSAERWIQGTTIFAQLPGCAELRGTRPEELPACEHNLALTRQAHVASDVEARREIYGKLLAGCARCHAAARAP